MQKSNAPTKLTVTFASGTGAGPVNNVPLTPGATPGTASYQTGFTSVNMEPIASGGIPPFGADFNGLFQAVTTFQQWMQAGYVYSYDSSFASNANINGYPQNAMVARADGNGYWLNLADGNTTNPDTGGANWAAVRANIGVSNIGMSDGVVVPAANQLAAPVIGLFGTLTANATLQLPLTAGASWIIVNGTTGGFSVIVVGATGSGVTVPSSTGLSVFTDGTNFYAVSSPVTGDYLPIDGTAVAATKLATARAFSITGLATAAAINFDGTGNVVFNVTALNVAGALGYTPANDASVVHIAGTETITGAKSFTQPIKNSSNATVSSPQTMAFSGSGSFGGGYGMYSGTFGAAMYITGSGSVTTLNFALGSNTAIASKGSLDSNGLFSASSASFSGAVSAASYGAVNGTTGTFSGAITATTANFTGSDRRLKRNIRKIAPRPLHRSVKFIGYTLKESGWYGLGATAQNAKRYAPEHVGTFEKDGKIYLSLNYAGMAYEQAIWDGQEIDRLTKRIAKLERVLDRARIEPRKRGFVRRLLEAIW